jgi:hypothetical protein
MADLKKLVSRASSSSWYLWILNIVLARMIPFNKPHGFKIISITPSVIRVSLPYKKKNLNHIKGIHACALATVSEFTTGFLLISRLDAAKYRLIMQRLEMDYHYQGKMDAVAEFTLTDEWLTAHIIQPLISQEAVVIQCTVVVKDIQGNALTTGKVYWQIKDWQKVKTKVS